MTDVTAQSHHVNIRAGSCWETRAHHLWHTLSQVATKRMRRFSKVVPKPLFNAFMR